MPIKLKLCCKRDNRVLSSSKSLASEKILRYRADAVILRHCVVKVMTFVVFTIIYNFVSCAMADFFKDQI